MRRVCVKRPNSRTKKIMKNGFKNGGRKSITAFILVTFLFSTIFSASIVALSQWGPISHPIHNSQYASPFTGSGGSQTLQATDSTTGDYTSVSVNNIVFDVGQTVSWSGSVTAIDSNANGYLYYNGNQIASNSASAPNGVDSANVGGSHTFASSGTKTWQVGVNAGYGLTKSGTDSITVNSDPTVSVSSTGTVDAGQTFKLTASVSGGTSGYSYQWYTGSAGSGSSISGATSSTYSTSESSAGTYDFYVVVKDATGYSVTSSTIAQKVNSDPSISVTSSKNPSDEGQTITFSTKVSGGSGTYNSYSYKLYDGTSTSDSELTSGTTSQFSYDFSSSGKFLLDYSVTDSLGYTVSSSLTQTVNTDPSASISSSQNPTDIGKSVEFLSSVSGGTPGYTYSWSANGNSYTSPDINVSFSSSGTYTIDLTVTDAAGYSVSKSYSETVNSAPTVSASSNLSSADVGYPIEFSSSPSGGTGGYAYSWVLNGNKISSSQDFSYSFSSSGSYTLTVTVTDSVGDSSSASVTVTVHPNPTVTVSSSQNPTDVGNSVTFSSSVSGGTGTITYSWLVNGIQESTSSQFSYSFSASGTYYINLTVSDSDSHTALYSFKETVNSDPKVTILNSPAPSDAGISVEFMGVASGGTGPYNYTWSINGQNFYSHEVNYTFSSSGTYSVSLTVRDGNGNTALDSINEVVNPDPTVTIAAEYNPIDQTANDTFTAEITGGAGPYNYTWENLSGDEIIGHGSKFVYRWNATGTYQLEVFIADSLGEKAYYTLSVSVISKPSTSIEGPDNADKGISNTWVGNSTDGIAPYTYTWLINGVSSGSGLFFTYSFPQTGIFHLELVSNDSQGVVTKAYLNVTVNNTPSVSLTAEYQQVDVGIPIDFNSTVSGGTGPFQWQYSISGMGFVGYQKDFTYVFSTPGTYTVAVKVIDAEGISSEENLSISVYAPPSVDLTSQYPIVDPNVMDFFNSSEAGGIGPYTFHWYVNGTYEGSGSDMNHSFSLPGVYPVTVSVVDKFGPTSESGMDVIVRNYPEAFIIASSNATDVGVNVSFRPSVVGGVGPYSYEWLARGQAFASQDLSISFASQGEYSIQLIVSDYLGKDATSFYNVSVYPDPHASILYNGTPVVSEEFPLIANLSGGLGPYKVQWIFPSGQQESGTSIEHVFQYSGPRSIEIAIRDATGFYGTQNFSIEVSLFLAVAANITSGLGPLSVQFSSSVLGGSGYSYNWSFGNGQNSLLQNPMYTFPVGNYTVSLTVTSANGAIGEKNITIQSLPPPALFSYSSGLNITQIFRFTAKPNWDASGPYNMSWSFPNGQTLSGMNVSYGFPVYNELNTVIATFTYGGGAVVKYLTVRMIPATPSISFHLPKFVAENTFIVLNATAGSPDAQIVNYSWNINGTLYYGQFVPYTFNENGNVSITASATDSLGATVNRTIVVDVLPVGSSNSIKISVSQVSSNGRVTFEINVISVHGIAVVEVLQGTNLLIPEHVNDTDGSNYNLTLKESNYAPGTYPLRIIVFNNLSQSNQATVAFVVSSQYGKTPYGFIQALGPTHFVLMVIGIVAVIGLLIGYHERSERIIEIPGTNEEIVGRNGHKLFLRSIRRRNDRI